MSSLDQPKILSLKKPLSLTQQAQMKLALVKKKVKRSVSQPPRHETLTQSISPSQKKSKLSQEDKILQHQRRKQRQIRRQDALTWLHKTFPACFHLSSPQPLKIGLLQDLFAHLEGQKPSIAPSRLSLRKALAYYTQSRAYHQALLSASHRLDLQGHPVQEVTDQERHHAQDQVAFLEKKYQAWSENRKRKKEEASQKKTVPATPEIKPEETSS